MHTETIWGIDLGVSSIGWAVIGVNESGHPTEIIALGSRILSISTDEKDEFQKGKSISVNAGRTAKRTTRKLYDRYQLRRAALSALLKSLGMFPGNGLFACSPEELWSLRSKAISEKISWEELGRVLYHINQKRGYNHAKGDEESPENKSKEKDYVAKINNRYKEITSLNMSVGQFFYQKIKESEIPPADEDKKPGYTYRIKDQVFPRKAYVEEFDKIMQTQKKYYPEMLTDEIIRKIRNEIIFYQRPLKSCKHLVSLCEFEKREYLNKEGGKVFDGPKVAPKSSPLFQVCKLWESVNNLVLKNREGKTLEITLDQRRALFDHLDNHEKLTLNDLNNILGINKKDGWWGGKAIGKGLQGNTTKITLKKAFKHPENFQDLFRFDLKITDSDVADEDTGEILPVVSPEFEKEPLYRLWHLVYSIKDEKELKEALQKKFGITDEETLDNLYKIDFTKSGYGNKSSKVIRKILPFLQQGKMYSEACNEAGFRHSESLTKQENQERELLEKLDPIKKNDLRQPVVEKILNQMNNLVNAMLAEYGRPDAIRVELARELKQSKEERKSTTKNINDNEKNNKEIQKKIEEEYGLRSTRNRVQKYKMWEESDHKCFYCGKIINVTDFLQGMDVEKEHIIPKSLLFDDSFANTVCACRTCNQEKGNRTAYDYLRSKSEKEFNDYLDRVEDYYKEKRISKTKRERLLASYEDYLERKKQGKETEEDKNLWENFINRQLKETQFISKKAKEILTSVCRNVYTTTGRVTDFVKHLWGWDTVLHDINLERYRSIGETEVTENDKTKQKSEKIKGWSKREDHRHHAVDALAIACTTQSIVQRLNNLSGSRDQKFTSFAHQGDEHKEKQRSLEEWVKERRPFSTKEVRDKVEEICVSYKAGKKSASTGKRYKYVKGKKVLLQEGITVPRGSLHEDTVYGKIKTLDKEKPLKYLFENPELIFKNRIKNLVLERLKEYDGDAKKARKSLDKKPIYLDKEKEIKLEHATCLKDEYVVKYSIMNIKAKDVDFIIDEKVREIIRQRLSEFNNNEKAAFKDLENHPVYYDKERNIPIKTVRCFTGKGSVESLRYNEAGEPIGFAASGNNHHIALYKDEKGKPVEHIATFWHVVERKKYGLPVIIENPEKVWDTVLSREEELPERFLNKLPDPKLSFETSFQQNEMFILGLEKEAMEDAFRENDYKTLSTHLYRVQKISMGDYYFRLHNEVQSDKTKPNQPCKRLYRTQSLKAFYALNPQKVRVTPLGKIEKL
ncbi:MAG: type II CRISPR RNA-guided endonuclease Cas9 [Bergeyella sp.]|nr:type II CRISPR RNA-guided endonuclease Cas9 [Bergeyella sp.]